MTVEEQAQREHGSHGGDFESIDSSPTPCSFKDLAYTSEAPTKGQGLAGTW